MIVLDMALKLVQIAFQAKMIVMNVMVKVK
jgi:hypothetical protein